jgi:NADPH2:quinone reductase
MRAWQVTEYGEPVDVLHLVDAPRPDLGPGELRIAVRTAALNLADVLLCRGTYQVKPPLPFCPGSEVAGVITEVGAEVTDFAPGDRVMAIAGGTGAFTDETVTSAAVTFALPATMDWNTAAAITVTYQTGYLGLYHRARLQPGETLLVHAGAGGVGSAAIQLGLAVGARVIATAGGPAKAQVCRDLGAEIAIDYLTEDFVSIVKEATGGAGADVVYDPVGGDTFDRSTKCIAFEGRIVVIGFTGGRFATARTNHMLVKNYDVLGVAWGTYLLLRAPLVRAAHAELMALWEAGKISPLVSDVVAFDDIPAALARLAGRGTYGKVVASISPAGDS